MNEVADVLVIGAGASGGVAALRFVEAGMRVVCLEQGDWPDRHGFPGRGPATELVAARQWSSSPAVRQAPADYPVDVTHSELGVVNFNGVGGGTVLYNAQWPRLLPDDFRVRTIDGVADDWPLSYAELQPYYEATDRAFGVAGLGGNPVYPPGADPPFPPLPIGSLATRVARAHAALGWHWWPGCNAILPVAHEGRHPCVQRGTCGSGCNEGAKGSTDVTHWPAIVARGGTLVTGARVHRVVLDERGRACGAEWVDREGRAHFQAADVVVLACNAIGTARLLLASATAEQADGLANSSGLVGRNLMLHPLCGASGVFDHPAADGRRAHNGALIQSLQFAGSDPSRGFVRGGTWALGTSGGPLAAIAAAGEAAWGSGHHREVSARLGRTASWVVICEDLPELHNRVTLSSTVTDDSGLAAPEIHYVRSENTRRAMAWQEARAAESLLAAGALRVESRNLPANGHFMGTARMGDDPHRSVVDRWNRCHDVPNLLIVDGSVFVTAGSANPTSTIAALALRAADALVARRAEVERPSHRRLSTAVTGVVRPTPFVAPPQRRQVVEDVVRERFAAIADQLIPAADGMPSARDAGVHGRRLDELLAARPDLADPLREVIGRLSDQPIPAEVDVADLARLRYAAAGAYYLSADVRERLGDRTGDPDEVRIERVPGYVTDGLLDHLFAE